MIRVPSFKIFSAPHEMLSQYDFRQSAFGNSYYLSKDTKDRHNLIALASKHELTVIQFETEEPHPRTDNDICEASTIQPASLPDCIRFSFCSMEYDRLFSMAPLKTENKYTDAYFVKNDNDIILGLAHPDKAYCLCVQKDMLIPFPESKPFNRLTRQSSSLGLNQRHNSHVT